MARVLKSRITAKLKPHTRKRAISHNASQVVEDVARELAHIIQERFYDEFYDMFKAVAGANIEYYRNAYATQTRPKVGNRFPTNNLFNSIDRRIDGTGRMEIFIDPSRAPYAAIHDKPEGEFTEIRAKSSDRPLYFFFHKQQRYFVVRQDRSIMRPGTGFFTNAMTQTTAHMQDLYEEIREEVVEEYNRRNRGRRR